MGKELAMDRVVGHAGPNLARRRVVAAWAALERAEALLPPGHPAMWHLQGALAACETEWRAQQPTRERPTP